MKNKIDRTQTGTKMLSTRAIALVLCCVMLLTAIGSGSLLNAFALTKAAEAADTPAAAETVDVDAAAADTSADDEAVSAPADYDSEEALLSTGLKKADSGLAGTGAKVDLAASGWKFENGARIYFDATAWYQGSYPEHMHVLFLTSEDSSNATGRSFEMTRIANTSLYYLQGTSDLGWDKLNDGAGIRFFSANGSWTGYENNTNRYTYSNITSYNGGSEYYITGKYNKFDIYNNNVYYFSATGTTGGYGPNKDHSASGNDSNDPCDINIWKSNQKASVYTDYATAGTYVYAGDSNTDKGGTISVNSRYFSGSFGSSTSNYYVSESGDSNESSTYTKYENAAVGVATTLKVKSVKSGYTFAGWYAADNSTLLSTNTEYTYYTTTKSGGELDHIARFTYDRAAYYVANNATLTSSSWDVDDPDGKMSLSTDPVWTKTFTGLNSESSSSQTYQFRITDGTNYLTDSSTSAPTGNVQPTMTGNNVTFTLGATETSWKVIITYNSSNNAVTVNAQEVAAEEEATGWLYSGVAAASRTTVDPIDGFSDNSSYYYVYGSAEDALNSNEAPSKASGTKYWIDCSGKYTAGTNFDIGISAYNTRNSLFGNSSTNFNENITSSSDTTILDTNGATLFKVQMRNRDSRYCLLIYSIDSSKVSDIGIMADIGNCTVTNQQASAVNYKIYYKGVGGGGSSSTQNFKVYAKDGTITDSDYGFGKYADTTISDSFGTTYTRTETDAEDEDYYTGTFSINKTSETPNTLSITTTVGSSYKSKMYVKGWCVNGVTYGYNTSDTVASDGVYTLSLDVTYEKFKDAYTNGSNKIIEITPIYYLVGATTVSFRVENFDDEVQGFSTGQGGWGNTLYAYPFYGALSNVDNSFGAYPGQPLIYYQGKYSIQIPIESISMKDASTDGTIVRGITLNNGYFDNAHKDVYSWTSTGQHKQTYDFDDFYKIYNEKNANDIIFRFKYRATTTDYNRDNYFDTSKTSLTSENITTLASDKGWEVLRDRAGRIIDIFGNPILKAGSTTEYATETSDITSFDNNKLFIVSMGYFDNNAGEYATEWVIFQNNGSGTGGTRIQSGANTDYKFSIVPSALLLNNNTRFATSVYKTYRDKPVGYYKDLYDVLNSTTTAKGKPAVIAYERDQERTNNAYRSDGRWYYTTSTDYVQSSIKIQYKTPAGVYVNDTYATDAVTDVIGVTTGAQAYFTNLKYEGKRQSDSEVYSAADSDKYTFTTVDGDDYQFAGWYIEVDGNTDKPTYTPINPDANGVYSVARTSSDVLVARFDPVKAGTVKVQHTVTQGSGTAEVKVEYGTSGSYTTLRDFGTSAYTVSSTDIKETNRSKNIKITLRTTAGTDNAFSQYDASSATKAISDYFPSTTGTTSSGVTTKEITISIGTLLDNDTTSLTYYSLLNAPTYKYDITYQYTSTRLKTSGGTNAELTYHSKGTMTSTAYKNNVTISGSSRTLSTAFISSVAPHESNFQQILSVNAATPSVNTYTYDSSTNTYTQTATVTFTASDDKNLTGVISLPYQWESSASASYGAKSNYIDYSSVSDYCTLAEPETSADGILEDYSAEPFNIYTVYGGYFVAGDTKTGFDFYDDNNKKYVITAPQTILGSETKEVTKYTIDSTGDRTWSAYTGTALENEYIRLLGVEGLEDTTANRETVRSKYTYNYNGTDYKCYRVSTETHYVPDGSTKYFQYWSLKNSDNVEVARCYFNELNMLAFENYNITPVYGDTELAAPENISTSISWMGESRNQWNYNGGSNVATSGQYGLMAASDSTAADYIWEDFAVDFEYNGEQLNEYTGSDIQGMGIVIQKAGDRVGTESSSAYYKELYKVTAADITDVKNRIEKKYNISNKTVSGKYSIKTISMSNLNNKNREDYFLRIANSYGWDGDAPTNVDTNYANSAMRVYSYIVVNNQVYVSENPAYFCTYGIANK